MARHRRVPIAVAVVALAAIVVGVAVLTSRGSSGDGESPIPQAEPFTLAPVIAGQAPAVLSGAPGHPVILAFFASWCAPCTQELPLIEKVARSAGPTGATASTGGLSVVGVDELDQRPDGPDLVRTTGLTFPAGYDHDGSIGRRWHIDGLPITVFIAPDGHVVDYHRGQLSQHQLDGLVRRLVSAGR